MRKFKKFLSAFLTLTMCSGLGGTVFASTTTYNENVRVINYSENISDESITELVNDVSASLVYKDGTVMPVDSVITIKDADKLRDSETDVYQVSVKSKIESDSDSKNNEGVSASVYLELEWEDALGVDNILESVSCDINLKRGTIDRTSIIYGSFSNARKRVTENIGKSTKFYKNANMTVLDPHASCYIYFEDAIFHLNVSVTPTIFD